MGRSSHGGIALPKKISQELGLSNDSKVQPWKPWTKRDPRARKDVRKAARAEKKVRGAPNPEHISVKDRRNDRVESSQSSSDAEKVQDTTKGRSNLPSKTRRDSPLLNGVDHREGEPRASEATYSNVQLVPKAARKQLAQDDAEIDALEKALGLAGKRSYSTAFETDGLDYLLEDLPGSQLEKNYVSDEINRLRESKNGIQQGRQNATSGLKEKVQTVGSGDSDFEGFESSDSTGEDHTNPIEESYDGKMVVSASSAGGALSHKARENPYRAPGPADDEEAIVKYMPPSLRAAESQSAENVSHLQRQLKGQLNRLSESNLPSIVSHIETISRNQSRNLVFEALIDLLVASVLDQSALQDTFLILLAAFVAALSKCFGAEFAVQTITKLDGEFERLQADIQASNVHHKECVNLVGVISNLYIFQIVGCGLMYDYVRICLQDLSESNTELLLRIIRVSGPQLRHDDPSALKDIVNQLIVQVADIDTSHLSVRTKFMIETITSLKDGKMKHGMAAASIAAEHTAAMKKTLGAFNQHNSRMLEPLSCGLQQIRTLGRQGKWRLIGASPQESHPKQVNGQHETKEPFRTLELQQEPLFAHNEDLVSLAREAGMNTDVRRSIFIAIMSASDCEDAELRLRKLRLSRNQTLEIAGVILRCTASEARYNPFYALIATRMASDHRSKMAFKFAIWNVFRRLGESFDEGDDNDLDELEENLEVRSVVNVARLYGTLIVNGIQDLGILNILNLVSLQQKTRLFVEILLISIIRGSQCGDSSKRDERSLIKAFMTSKHMPEMASSLRYFLRKTLSKSDVLNDGNEQRLVKWACRILSDTLTAIDINGS